MTERFEVTLKPVANYFFGGERTFGEGDTANYSAESNLFPQQTALLGVLRYRLLEQHHALPLSENRPLANALIGKRSFQMDDSQQDFGIIRSVGPLLLKKDDTHYRITNEKEKLIADFSPAATLWTGAQSSVLPALKEYVPKNGYPDYLVNLRNHADKILLSDVITTQEEVGIYKTTDGGDHTDGFFKQTSCRMAKGCRFVFHVQAAPVPFEKVDYSLQPEQVMVSFGAEQKQFMCKIRPMEAEEEVVLPVSPEPRATDERIVLISDAWVNDDFYDYCAYAQAETTSFRTVTYDHDFKGPKPTRLNLLRKGGVLYPREGRLRELGSYLQQWDKYRSVGFNHFLYQPEPKN